MEASHLPTRRGRSLGFGRTAVTLLSAVVALTFGLIWISPSASADGGDFSLDFQAAEPSSYDHDTGVGGVNGATDEGTVESLEGGDFTCGDKVVFFTRVTVVSGAVGEQTIRLDLSWTSDTSSGDLVGFTDLLSASANPNPPDSGHLTDGDEVVSIISESAPSGSSDAPLLATVEITNLSASESFILRTVAVLECRNPAGSHVNGTIQGAIESASVTAGGTGSINVGQQTVPLLSAGNIIQPGSITIVKDAQPDAATAFAFTATGAGVSNFSLTDDGVAGGESVTFGDLTDFTNPYTFTELAAPGWTLSSISCDDPETVVNVAGGVATVHLDNNEDVTCTFTNTSEIPSIDVTKTADPVEVAEPGDDVVFTVAITNTSANETVTIDSILDDVYGNLGDVANAAVTANSCPALIGTTLAAGASTSCTFTAPVTGNAGSTHTDTVTVAAHDDENQPASDFDDATVTVTDVPPIVTVLKGPNPSTLPETGGDVTYTVVVTNTSFESVTITSLSDDVFGTLAGDADCEVGTVLAPAGQAGDSCEFSFTETLAGQEPGTTHTNTVTVVVEDDDGTSAHDDDDAVVTFTDVAPTIVVQKDPDPATLPENGGDVTYTVEVANTSFESVTITSLSDSVFGTLAGDADCEVGTVLAPAGQAGDSCEFTFTETLAGQEPGTTHVNVVTAVAVDNDGTPASDNDDAVVGFTDVLPSITVVKTADPTSMPEPGGVATFTVVITNTSIEPVTITSLTDDVYGDISTKGTCTTAVGSVLAANGGTYSCSFDGQVSGNAGESFTDVVTAVAEDNEHNLATDDDDATVTLTDVLSSILVTKTADPTSVPEPGDEVLFTVEIENTSTVDDITIDSIVDDVFGDLADPANALISGSTCDDLIGDTLAPGGSTSCTFTAEITGNAGDSHTDTVTVEGTDDDGAAVSDFDDATVTVTDVVPTVTIEKTADPTSIPENGGEVTYTVVVTNTSFESVTITSLSDSVFGTLAGDADCEVGTVLAPAGEAGDSCEFSFTETLAGQEPETTHTNVATVVVVDDDESTATDDDDADVGFTDVLPVIVIDKTANPTTVHAGDPVTYTYAVTNGGVEPLQDVTVVDDRCGPVTYVSGDTNEDDLLDVTETWIFSCTTTLTGNTVNTGTATGSDNDGNQATDDDTAEVIVLNPSIVIVKSASATSVAPGASVTFTYTVTNPGDAPLANVVVTDDKCSPVTYGSGDTDGDGKLDPGETWLFGCTTTMPSQAGAVTNVGTVTGVDPLGKTVRADDTETVTVVPVEVLGTMARTGSEVWVLVSAAVGLLLGGLVLEATTRRRRSA